MLAAVRVAQEGHQFAPQAVASVCDASAITICSADGLPKSCSEI
jgi:hypothetical protein